MKTGDELKLVTNGVVRADACLIRGGKTDKNKCSHKIRATYRCMPLLVS